MHSKKTDKRDYVIISRRDGRKTAVRTNKTCDVVEKLPIPMYLTTVRAIASHNRVVAGRTMGFDQLHLECVDFHFS